MRRTVAVLAALALLTALCITPAIADEPTRGGLVKVDRINPVQATDVEMGKKVTIKGSPGGKGKPSTTQPTATGTLNGSIGGDGNRYAVVVGISDYPGTVNDLSYCDDDAQDTYNALVNVYHFNNVTLLKDLEATRSAIIDAINALPANAGEIVFSVSSHGSRGMAIDGDGELWDEAIIAHNGTTTTQPIWDGELKGLFERFTSAKIVFIFDTCYAGGMKDDLQGPNRFIAMACGEKQLSVEGPAWQNGEFTYYLVDQGILQGLANTHDYNGDGSYRQSSEVTAEEAFDYAMANCRSDHPTVGDYYNDDFPF